MRIASFVFALVALAMSAGAAHAKSAVQVTPDESFVLVNKPVGTEQWVLTFNLFDDILTGNVFDTSGTNAPVFFSCDVLGDNSIDLSDLANQTLTFDCMIASGCSALPCDATVEWHALGGSTPALPGSFFLP